MAVAFAAQRFWCHFSELGCGNEEASMVQSADDKLDHASSS